MVLRLGVSEWEGGEQGARGLQPRAQRTISLRRPAMAVAWAEFTASSFSWYLDSWDSSTVAIWFFSFVIASIRLCNVRQSSLWMRAQTHTLKPTGDHVPSRERVLRP